MRRLVFCLVLIAAGAVGGCSSSREPMNPYVGPHGQSPLPGGKASY
jgi:hypothetical protein